MFKTFLRQSREAKKKFINFSPFGRNSKSFEQLKDSFEQKKIRRTNQEMGRTNILYIWTNK